MSAEIINIMQKSGKILFTEKELEKMGFGNAATLRNYRHLGRGLPFVRIGQRSIRYRRDDLINHLNANRVDPEND